MPSNPSPPGTPKEVRFRSDGGLFEVRNLPGRERDDAKNARRGLWASAPDDDPLWDGEARCFREKELSVDELASLLKQRRKSKRKVPIGVGSLFGKPDFKTRVERELAEQGSYVDPLSDGSSPDISSQESSVRSEVESESTDWDDEEGHRYPVYSPNHHKQVELKPALKNGYNATFKGASISITGSKHERKHRDSLRGYAEKKNSMRRRSKRYLKSSRLQDTLSVIDRDHILVLGFLIVASVIGIVTFEIIKLLFGFRNAYLNVALVVSVIAIALWIISHLLALLPNSARKVLQSIFNKI